MRVIFLTMIMGLLIGCATSTTSPDLPASAYASPSATPNNDYIYRSPPPAAMGALGR